MSAQLSGEFKNQGGTGDDVVVAGAESGEMQGEEQMEMEAAAATVLEEEQRQPRRQHANMSKGGHGAGRRI